MGEVAMKIKEDDSYKSSIIQKILTDEELDQCNIDNWKFSLAECLGFISLKSGYDIISGIISLFRNEMSRSEFKETYNVSDVDECIKECIDHIKLYKNIIIHGYDYCEEHKIECAEFVNAGLTEDEISYLKEQDIFSLKQLFEAKLEDGEMISSILKKTDPYIDTMSDYLLLKEIKFSIRDYILKDLEPYMESIVDFDTYKKIFNPWHKMLGQSEITNRVLTVGSNSILKSNRINYRVVCLTDQGLAKSVAITKEGNDMKKRACDTSVFIADNRQRYPYGFLYGALSPKEQNKLPNTYEKNTIELLDNLSKINKEVAIVIAIDRDSVPFEKIIEDNNLNKKADINDIRHIAYKAVKENKDVIFHGFNKSHLAAEIRKRNDDVMNSIDKFFKDYGITAMTARILKSKGISSIGDINNMKGLSDLQKKLSGIDPKHVGIVQEELLKQLNVHNYDTTRFGYLGKLADADENQLTTGEFNDLKKDAIAENDTKNKMSDIDKAKCIREAVEYIKPFADKNTTIGKSSLDDVLKEFTRLWRGLGSKDKFEPLSFKSFYTYLLDNSDYTVSNNGDGSYTFKNKRKRKTPVTETVDIKINDRKKFDVTLNIDKIEKHVSKFDFEDDAEEKKTSTSISQDDLANILSSMPAVEVKAIVNITCPGCGTTIEVKDTEFFCPTCFKKIKVVF